MGRVDLQAAQQRGAAPRQRRALGEGGHGDVAGRSPGQQVGQPGRRHSPVGLQVAVDEDHGAGRSFGDAAVDRHPLLVVAQQVEVDGGVGGDAQPEAGGHRPVLAAAQEEGPQVARVLDLARAVAEARPRCSGHDELQAAGVGDDRLAAIDRPHLRRRNSGSDERAQPDLGVELQVAATGVGQPAAADGQKSSQPLGGGVQGGGRGQQRRGNHPLQHPKLLRQLQACHFCPRG